MSAQTLHAGHLFTPRGWLRDARLRVEHVVVAAIEEGEPHAGEALSAKFVLPGMPNLHSHAFQRAMAGLAERRGHGDDSFWSWRETMYAFAARIGPDELRAIAAQLYAEMLEAGYTHVCEFHYLHHAPDGRPGANPAEMSLAIVEAARETGIGLTLLPVLYMTGGFDGRPLSERQRRFGLSALESPGVRVGLALHSLRAVPEAAMREVLDGLSPLPSGEGARKGRVRVQSKREVAGWPERSPQPLSRGERGFPIHIHIAEQIGEVQDCLAVRGARPVQWLFDHFDVDARWCLVHATQIEPGEVRRIAKSGAVAGLCPTTEANLGDGLFPLAAYLDAGGTLGIGSDSHISVSPVEELRWLEYGQRLITRHRNVTARAPGESVGETLWRAALRGGAQASGITPFGEGAGADFIVLDAASPLLAARDVGSVLDSFLFAGNTPLVRDVMADGQWVVRDGRHRDRDAIAARYRAAVQRLVAMP